MKCYILLLFLIYFASSSAIIINIPEDYTTIQEGINVAISGDTVLVAPGTYVENINYNGKNITVASLFHTTQDTSYISQTIIDGDRLDSVVKFENGESSDTSIIGFTITNGSNFVGGGIKCSNNSNPNMTNLIIIDNHANYGGGIRCVNNSNPIIRNVRVFNNYAEDGGGGIEIGCSSEPILENVTILNNNTDGKGGGIHCWEYSSPTLSNVTIVSNTANNKGGGIYCLYHSNIIFDEINRCNIYLNFAGYGNDLYTWNYSDLNVIVDTFTVSEPDINFANPFDNFTFDILNSKIEQVNQDLYVNPNGDNANSGLGAEDPLQTIDFALEKIMSIEANPNTIFLANGIYSLSNSGEHFPINCKSNISIIGENHSQTILDGDNNRGVIYLLDNSNLSITDLTVTHGHYYNSDGAAGGIHCKNSNPIFENIIISDNVGFEGGGITCINSNPIFKNMVILNNYSFLAGGNGIYCYNSNPLLINVTLADNDDINGNDGTILCANNSNPILINCILWNELFSEIIFLPALYGSSSTITIAHCDIEGGLQAINTNNNGVVNWLEGNIDLDPLFINTIVGDYHLQDTSHCIGAGVNEIEINEIWYYSPQFDIEGNPRPSPEGSMPDIGAYENILGEPQVGIIDDLTITINYLYNYPNPFNPETTIFFNLSEVENVELEIFNIKGQKVKQLVSDQLSAGQHSIVWDGKDSNNKQVSSGIYFYKLQSGEFQKTKKMILLK